MRPVALLVAASLLLAGCNGLPGGTESPEPAETVTPAPVPATDGNGMQTHPPERITRPPGTPLPPGVSADGSVNATELVCANNRYLLNRSHTVVYSYPYRQPGQDGVLTGEGTTTIRAEGDRVVYEFGDPDSEATNVTYFDPTGRYERRVSKDTVRTRCIVNDTRSPVTGFHPGTSGSSGNSVPR